jgi:hypothetical protein
MRKTYRSLPAVVAIVVPLTSIGCSKSPRDRLQGRWLGEAIENVPIEQIQKATGWVKGTAVEFAGNKVTVTIPAETPRTGTFKVTKAEGDLLVVSFFRDEGGRDDAEMKLVGDQAIRWQIGQGREILLIRAKN